MQVVVNIPDQYLLDIPVAEIGRTVKAFYRPFNVTEGQLSAGVACEFAGVDRYTFLAACKQNNIPAIDYDEEELEVDFEHLKQVPIVLH